MLEKTMNSMSAKQIRGALGLKKSTTAKLKAELQKLIKDGKIDKKGSRYFLTVGTKIREPFNAKNKKIKMYLSLLKSLQSGAKFVLQ